MEFHEKLKTIREAKGLKPVEVVKRAKVSKGYYSTLESGKQKKPGIQIATRLARALDVTVDELLSPLPFNPDKPTDKPDNTVRIDDPDIRMFFSGEWDTLEESEKEWIKRAIKIAKDNQKKAEEEVKE